MKALSRIGIVLGLLALAGAALAASSISVETYRKGFSQGIVIGKSAFPKNDATGSGNVITKSFGTSFTYDPASVTATCTESSAQTLTGAVVGDTCSVGPPAAAGTMNVAITCYVSAADAVKVKVCNPTAGAIDVLSGTFYVRTFSAQ